MGSRWQDKLVLITGASAGIGRAAVEEFVREGARIIAVARSEDRLRELARSFNEGRVIPLAADVSDAGSMQLMASKVLETGVPDVIVANAGIGLDALFTETSDESLKQVFEVNVYGLVRTIRPFLPGMIQRGSGRVLLVSSIVGKRGIPHYSVYSASKFALHGIADALRSELYHSGVSVGVVCPSSTTTEFQDHILREGPAQKRSRPRRHPPEAVARAIVRMAGSRRREVILGVEAKLLHLADTLAPGLIDWLLARMLTRR